METKYHIEASGPFYKHGLTVIPAWINNYIHYNVRDEITYPLPNFRGTATEVWQWIRNFIAHFIAYVITYSCWDYSKSMLVKGAPVDMYCKISNIKRTKSPNLNASRLVLQLPLPNPMKPGVTSRMKM